MMTISPPSPDIPPSLRERDDAIPRGFVLAQPRERGRPEVAVLRELEEMDLADRLGAGPEGDVRVRDLGDLVERARSLEGSEPCDECTSTGLGEPRADTPDVNESIPVVGAEDDRAERVTPLAFARGHAADHAIERCLLLDLDPVLAPSARLVPARCPFRDDALEASCENGAVVVHASRRDEVADDDMAIDLHEIAEDLLALDERAGHHLAVLDIQHIEDDVRRGEGPGEVLDPNRVARLLPFLELREARAVAVHDDDLPIENRVRPRPHADLRVAALDERETAVLEAVAVADETDRPRPIPLELVDVVRGVEWRLAGVREHRPDHVPVWVHPLSRPLSPRDSREARP